MAERTEAAEIAEVVEQQKQLKVPAGHVGRRTTKHHLLVLNGRNTVLPTPTNLWLKSSKQKYRPTVATRAQGRIRLTRRDAAAGVAAAGVSAVGREVAEVAAEAVIEMMATTWRATMSRSMR